MAVLTVAAGIAFPLFRGAVDGLHVRAAREAAIAFVARARAEARAHGGAELRIEQETATLEIVRADSVRARLSLATQHGVEIAVGGDEDVVDLRFGPRGLGKVASRTIEIRKGRAEHAIVISSYGRVTRR